MEQFAADGKKRTMNLYNLDMIISVGYRVNSKRATHFRQCLEIQRIRSESFHSTAMSAFLVSGVSLMTKIF